MSVISWSCRGLGNPLTVRMLLDFTSRFKPDFIFLMEVKVRRRKVDIVQRRLK